MKWSTTLKCFNFFKSISQQHKRANCYSWKHEFWKFRNWVVKILVLQNYYTNRRRIVQSFSKYEVECWSNHFHSCSLTYETIFCSVEFMFWHLAWFAFPILSNLSFFINSKFSRWMYKPLFHNLFSLRVR